MEAKDTVMDLLELGNHIIPCEERVWNGAIRAVQAQAEISFKAGQEFPERAIQNQLLNIIEASKKAGIQEVVDWLKEIGISKFHDALSNQPHHLLLITDIVWQAKLKEWGINP